MLKIPSLMLVSFLMLLSSHVLAGELLKPESATKEIQVLTEDIRVELDVFSGLPNPTWLLSSAEAEAFDSLLTSLPSLQQAPPLIGNLGVRGGEAQ